MTIKTCALLGAAGYIAPRHMQAIRDTGNVLVAAMDRNDSVGIIDSYFPGAHYFTEFERFDRHLDLLRREGRGIDYLAICSPNYLHDSHMRFAMRSGADAICEKPLVLNPWTIDGLLEMEKDTGRRVNSILQLRLHDSVNELKQRVADSDPATRFDVDLTYITSRGRWYYTSWKGDVEKSGGIATNIGVHFYDMLHYVFGALKENVLHYSSPSTSAGYLEYEKARVRWFLSIDEKSLPPHAREKGLRTHRNIRIGDEDFEFSGGFTDLHTRSYEAILEGKGFGLEENRVAIETVAAIRKLSPDLRSGEVHPALHEFMKLPGS
jgi:UDP-N-acetyl-2-amino-2-deoxyglucuronate dehydrogenase